MRKALKRLGKVGVVLLVLNELRGATTVAMVLGSWLHATPSAAHETSAQALMSSLKCGVLLVGC